MSLKSNRFIVGVLLTLMVVMTAACGGDKSNSSPTKPTSTVTAVSFGNATDFMKIGEKFTFTATASHSDGSNQQVTDWFSDVPSVATVDAAGVVTAVGPGVSNIAARHDGMQVVKQIRVAPDYQARWSGRYKTNACVDAGDFDGLWCEMVLGSTGAITLTLSQNRDSVSGTIAFGSVTGPVSGLIGMDGSLTLSGGAADSDSSVSLVNWSTHISGNSMAGTFKYHLTISGLSGWAEETCELTTVTKGFDLAVDRPTSPIKINSPNDMFNALGRQR